MRFEAIACQVKRLLALFDRHSSATTVRRRLLQAGVASSEINDSHIHSFYESLVPFKDRPTFLPIGISGSIGHIQDPAPVSATIIETRKHTNIENICLQLANRERLPIQIFHGKKNKAFLLSTQIGKLIENNQAVLTQLDVDDLSADLFNSLLLSTGFWDRLYSREKILFFQTDTALCSCSPNRLEQFMAYDYIGSQWARKRPIGAIIDGGNGGLSLRDWAKSRDCLSRFAPTLWPGGEDSYFAFHIELIGGRVARSDECADFSTQYYFRRNSWGAHKVSDLSATELSRFLKYCPESRNTF